VAGAKVAWPGGAARIELCASLAEGGLTPSRGMIQAAAHLETPAHAMVRPRSGLFCFTPDEVDVMCAGIVTARGWPDRREARLWAGARKRGGAGARYGRQRSTSRLPLTGRRVFSDFDPPGGWFVTDTVKVRATVEALE